MFWFEQFCCCLGHAVPCTAETRGCLQGSVLALLRNGTAGTALCCGSCGTWDCVSAWGLACSGSACGCSDTRNHLLQPGWFLPWPCWSCRALGRAGSACGFPAVPGPRWRVETSALLCGALLLGASPPAPHSIPEPAWCSPAAHSLTGNLHDVAVPGRAEPRCSVPCSCALVLLPCPWHWLYQGSCPRAMTRNPASAPPNRSGTRTGGRPRPHPPCCCRSSRGGSSSSLCGRLRRRQRRQN